MKLYCLIHITTKVYSVTIKCILQQIICMSYDYTWFNYLCNKNVYLIDEFVIPSDVLHRLYNIAYFDTKFDLSRIFKF